MNKHNGFTLIELIVVIAILGILSVFALPRFVDIADEAHESVIEGTAGALSSAVALVKAQWVAAGNQVAVRNLPGYGEPDNVIDVSSDGWPTGVNGNINPNAMTAEECNLLFEELLQSNAPSISRVVGSDYLTTINNGNCRYTYQLTTNGDYIEYDAETGEISTEINGTTN